MALRTSILNQLKTLMEGVTGPAFANVAVMRATDWNVSELPACNIRETPEGEEVIGTVSCGKVRVVLHVDFVLSFEGATPYDAASEQIYNVLAKLRADETGARTLSAYNVYEIQEVGSRIVTDQAEQKVAGAHVLVDFYYERNRLSGTT
jgi:hypothetical protein